MKVSKRNSHYLNADDLNHSIRCVRVERDQRGAFLTFQLVYSVKTTCALARPRSTHSHTFTKMLEYATFGPPSKEFVYSGVRNVVYLIKQNKLCTKLPTFTH